MPFSWLLYDTFLTFL